MKNINLHYLHCLAAVLSLIITPAQAKPTLEDYAAEPVVSMVTVSPKGNLVAFRRQQDGTDLLIVYSLTEKKMVTGLSLEKINPRSMYFLDQSKIVLVASNEKRLNGFRGIHDISTAFCLDLKDNSVKQLLTPGDRIYLGQTGLGHIVGTADGNVYMPAYVGEGKYDQSPRYSLMRVELSSPKRPKEAIRGSDFTIDYFLGKKGKLLAREDYNNKTNEHQILVKKDGKWQPIFSQTTNIRDVGFEGLRPDYKGLVALDESEDTGHTEYYNFSLEDGKFYRTGWGRDDADIDHVLQDINRVVHGIKYSGFTPSYKMLDEKLNTRIQSIVDRFPDHTVVISDWSPDWKHLIIFVEGSSNPGSFYLFSEGQAPRKIAQRYDNFTEDDVNPLGKLTIKASDGLVIPTLVTIPKDKVNNLKNLPAVMLPHGGPASYDTIGFRWLPQALANAGYLVIQPQFRGSKGFGAAHELAGYGEWGGKMQKDLTDTLDALIKKGIVDRDRVCIAGGSYGGYAALAGGAFTPDLYKCVVSFNGVSDIPSMLRKEEHDYGDDNWVVSYWENVIANGKAEKDFVEKISPANSAETFKAPVLLLHGTRDDTVAYSQSKKMYNALKRAHKEVKLVKLNKENHHLEKPENRLILLNEVVAFINANIGQ